MYTAGDGRSLSTLLVGAGVDRDRRLSDARRAIRAPQAILRWLYRWPLFIPFIVPAS